MSDGPEYRTSTFPLSSSVSASPLLHLSVPILLCLSLLISYNQWLLSVMEGVRVTKKMKRSSSFFSVLTPLLFFACV